MESSTAFNLLDAPLLGEDLEQSRPKHPWSFLMGLLGDEAPSMPRTSKVESPLSESIFDFQPSLVDAEPVAREETSALSSDKTSPSAESMTLDPAQTELALDRSRSLAARAQIAAVLMESNKDSEGRDSLHTAARFGRKELTALLVESGADVNSADNTGRSPLHYAALCGSREVAEILLANQADANARNEFGGTPLHGAALFGSKDVVELLLAHQADVNAPDRFGQTPLHAAVRRGSLEVLHLLLASEADVNARDSHGNSPLQDAALGHNREVVELLREHRGRE